MAARKLKFLLVGCCLMVGGCATAPGHVEPYKDVSCLGRAAISLADAIAAAEAPLNRALAAHVKTEKQQTTHVIELVSTGRIRLARVDPESAAVRDG